MNALGLVLPGLRERPEVLELFVRRVLVMVADGGNSPERKRVTLSCWLNTVFALQASASDSSARFSIWWRLCGGGGAGGHIRDGAKGAKMEEVVAVVCMIYNALGPTGADRPDFPTDEGVLISVHRFYAERDKSWVKRSAIKYGLGRRSTARLIGSLHGLVYEALDWGSPLCLGVPVPPRQPPPEKSSLQTVVGVFTSA